MTFISVTFDFINGIWKCRRFYLHHCLKKHFKSWIILSDQSFQTFVRTHLMNLKLSFVFSYSMKSLHLLDPIRVNSQYTFVKVFHRPALCCHKPALPTPHLVRLCLVLLKSHSWQYDCEQTSRYVLDRSISYLVS